MRGLPSVMSSPSSAVNPFERFALGSTAVAVAPAAVQLDNERHRRKKRMRTIKDSEVANAAESREPKGLVEKYKSPGEPEWPLQLIVVGHNPSNTAWQQGHYYANPSNRMYKLLATAKIIPGGFSAMDDDKCPIICGVGFTDVGFSVPGTVSSEFAKTDLHAWREGFFNRLEAHARRAAATAVAAEGAIGEKTEATEETESTGCVSCGYPKIVTFAGKRQWEELFYDACKEAKAQTRGGIRGTFRFGRQPSTLRPPGWPFPSESTEIFVVPSSSGAAAMTSAARTDPYIELGKHLEELGGWNRKISYRSMSVDT